MNTILDFKNDLEHYPINSLHVLQRYFGLPAANKRDLVWLIAIHQAQNNSRGTMDGDEWTMVSETNVFDYDQILDFLQTIIQLEEQKIDYKVTTLNQNPVDLGLEANLRKRKEDVYNLILSNKQDDHSWRFIAEFIIKTNHELPDHLWKNKQFSEYLPLLREAEVESVDERGMVKGEMGLNGGETIVLKAKSNIPRTKAARGQ